MPLLSKVGLYRSKSVFALAVFYGLLAAGGVTMVVPFMMTLTCSVTNRYDFPQYNVLPRFVYDEDEMFIKFLIHKYGRYEDFKTSYRIEGAPTLTELSESKNPLRTHFAPLDYARWDPAKLAAAGKDWEDFWAELRQQPEETWAMGIFYPEVAADDFREYLRGKYLDRWRAQHPQEVRSWNEPQQEKAAISLLNQTYGVITAADFRSLKMWLGGTGRLWIPAKGPRFDDYVEFISRRPARAVYLRSLDAEYRQFLREKCITLEKVNEAWGTAYRYWDEIRFSNQPPAARNQQVLWTDFVTKRMPLQNVFLDLKPRDADFQAWLLAQYGSLEKLNHKLGTSFRSFKEIPFSNRLPEEPKLRLVWSEFAVQRVPVERWKFPHPLQRYHDFLQRRYGAIEQLTAAYGRPYVRFDEVRVPQAALDRMEFLTRKAHWRWFFLTDNFVQVFRYIAVRGYALWNTLILVGATLLGALTINPLAAYALSRFRIRWKQAILILFLVPMAFPGEVAQIPSFILTRDLHLLNTYWALILPGLAHGFSIFMLKGFFDGLPRELYEAAALDGANELQIYWNITYPLCKPILALTVLNVVISAYSGFMWAFIVCPDENMWTLAVWIFQFSVDAAEAGRAHQQMAALVLMSIPTMIIFFFTQKIIMKGIVLPTMK